MEQNNEDSNTIIGQIKNEPYNKDIKTQRIIQYFEDSKESDALDKIRMISSRAKGKSNANKSLASANKKAKPANLFSLCNWKR